MQSLLRSRPFILILVIVGAFVIMVMDVSGYLDPLDNVIHGVLRPIDITFTEFRTSAEDVIQTARDLRTLRQRNTELEDLVERLTVENLQLSEVATENEQLRSFFEFALTNSTYDYRGGQIIANVISEGASPYVDIVEIDLGESHGIEVGMPVVTDRGLIGRIVEVHPRSSLILLLSDTNSSVNVMTQASRAPGTLRGRTGQLPLMDLIPPDVEVSVGEIIITSGLGGNFPKGLVVGQIVEILQNDNQMFQQAIIRPTVDFDRLELVLVITSFPPAPDEDATATNDEEAGIVEPEEGE